MGLGATPWPKFKRDKYGRGLAGVPTNTDGTVRWKYHAYSMRCSPAIGADGTIYVIDTSRYWHAVNPDGTRKWRAYHDYQDTSFPAVDENGVIYAGGYYSLYAAYPDGTRKWKYSTGSYVPSSPNVASDGTILVGSRDNYLYAINPDGSLRWRYNTGDAVESSPALDDADNVYFCRYSYYVYSLDIFGNLRWSRYLAGEIFYASPAVVGNVVYVAGSELYALAKDTGDALWNVPLGAAGSRSSPCVASDGTIYVGTDDGYLYAVDPNGTVKWSQPVASDAIRTAPVVCANGFIYVGSRDYKFYCVNPNGTVKWSYTTGNPIYGSAAIGSDGTVYVTSTDRYLYAFPSVSGAIAPPRHLRRINPLVLGVLSGTVQ
jgi:outer membrane protein assembly factor BamB